MTDIPIESEVRTLLQRFQDGYTRRDVGRIDAFMDLFAADQALEVIGTNAIETSSQEWCRGVAATRALIAADWESWGDLVLDVGAARIQERGDFAWLSATGTVAQKLPLDHAYAGMGQFLQRFMASRESPDIDVEQELMTIILGAASALSDRRRGEDHLWPIRFTATLVRQDEGWRFAQIHFSYPTVHLPQVRFR